MSSRHNLVSAGLAAGFTALYAIGLNFLPFHPDESSWVFMSRDFARLFLAGDAGNLAWQPGDSVSKEVEYRLLNAPLPKYLIGLGWWLAGYAEADLNHDWDWTQSWTANQAAGNLPDAGLLAAARAPGLLLTALSAALMFRIGQHTRGEAAGWAAAIALGANALMLLHGRRAMAEAAGTCFALATVWAALQFREANRRKGLYAALTGAMLGLAIASKQTNIALAPVALLAALAGSPKHALGRWAYILASAGLVFFALNPILYRDPVGAARAMMDTRVRLARAQAETVEALFPGMSTPAPPARLRAAILQVYFQPPAYSDLPIYVDEVSRQALAYQARAFTGYPQTLPVGAVLLAFSLIGAAVSALRLLRRRANDAEALCWLWAASVLALTLAFIPLDWQRYYLPLLPPACLFAALGVDSVVDAARQAISQKRAAI